MLYEIIKVSANCWYYYDTIMWLMLPISVMRRYVIIARKRHISTSTLRYRVLQWNLNHAAYFARQVEKRKWLRFWRKKCILIFLWIFVEKNMFLTSYFLLVNLLYRSENNCINRRNGLLRKIRCVTRVLYYDCSGVCVLLIRRDLAWWGCGVMKRLICTTHKKCRATP